MNTVIINALVLLAVGCAITSSLTGPDGHNCVPRDCLELMEKTRSLLATPCSGVYTIKPDYMPPFKVYCDMETDGGGWTVFQRRMDGSKNFNSEWDSYKYGFGKLDGEFWLGLEKLNRLTESYSHLRVDLADFDNNTKYAHYDLFYIDDVTEDYEATIRGYKGTAGNSFSTSDGIKFSTPKVHNDKRSDYNCAKHYKGAWWYNACGDTNLNGLYLKGATSKEGAFWKGFNNEKYSLKFTEMKVRRYGSTVR